MLLPWGVPEFLLITKIVKTTPLECPKVSLNIENTQIF